jgi:23S rRNA (uracil1939-C5)-methyltransferase
MMQQEQERVITHHTVTLGPLTREGDTQVELVQQDADGTPQKRLLRVPAGLPGERVTIAVEEPLPPRSGRRSRRWKPRPPKVWITELHEASPLRTAAPCPVFGTCGGCQLQHMQYAAQLAWKRDVVCQLLQEIGGFDNPPLLPTVPCDIPWHYRNHMRFSVNREGKLGLTARGTHRVLPLQECPIAEENINRTLSILSQHENPRPQALVRCSAYSQQVMLQPVPPQEVATQLAEAGLDLHTETMEETLAGATFRIRPSSFFQTNTAQAEKMAQMVLSGLLPTSDQSDEAARQLTVVDAYCGVGTFALLLAHHVGKVIAIEESASAIKDAQWNMRTIENVEILKGKVEVMLPTLSSRIDGLVIDPPRAGCQQVVLDALIQHPVSRIVYVSCEPSTLARDLNILCHLHPVYRLRTIQPLDMFPQTAHIESVAVLEHVEPEQPMEDNLA